GTEQLGPRVQSPGELARAGSGQETDRGKGILSQIFRSPEKPVDKTPETGRPVWLVDYGLFHWCLHLAVCGYREQDEPFESHCRAANIGDGRRQTDGSLGNAERRH